MEYIIYKGKMKGFRTKTALNKFLYNAHHKVIFLDKYGKIDKSHRRSVDVTPREGKMAYSSYELNMRKKHYNSYEGEEYNRYRNFVEGENQRIRLLNDAIKMENERRKQENDRLRLEYKESLANGLLNVVYVELELLPLQQTIPLKLKSDWIDVNKENIEFGFKTNLNNPLSNIPTYDTYRQSCLRLGGAKIR